MCIHFFQAQYTCGCTRELSHSGANHKGPVICLSVKTAYDRYHAQPFYPPPEQPCPPPPKPCPPISHTGASRTPGNIALLQVRGLCFVHWQLTRLCQDSEEQRIANYLHARDSGYNIAAMSFPLTAWRETGGDQDSTGKHIGEDGPFRGVECYTVDPAESLVKGEVQSILTIRSGAQIYSIGSIVSPEQRENTPTLSSKLARKISKRHKRAQHRKQKKLELKRYRRPSLHYSESCGSAPLATDDDYDVDVGMATPTATPMSLLSPSGVVAEIVGASDTGDNDRYGHDGEAGKDTLESLLEDTLLYNFLAAEGGIGHRRSASF